MRLRRAAGAAALLLAAGACGGEGNGSGPAADAPGGAAPCTPVGAELENRATEQVEIVLSEFAFSPDQADVGAGVVTFNARNAGRENHELAFLPGGGEVPVDADGAPDEDALAAAGAFELEAFGPGRQCDATYDLRPGTYTLFCIVTSPDGRTHYDKGMRGRLVVT